MRCSDGKPKKTRENSAIVKVASANNAKFEIRARTTIVNPRNCFHIEINFNFPPTTTCTYLIINSVFKLPVTLITRLRHRQHFVPIRYHTIFPFSHLASCQSSSHILISFNLSYPPIFSISFSTAL